MSLSPLRIFSSLVNFTAATVFALSVLGFAGCEKEKSLAIYSELAKDRNVLMQPGLNRRVFNTVEAQSGRRIALNADGSITLQPGRYHISGFSIVTMQDHFAAPASPHKLSYPGYCLVYPKEFEARDPLRHQIGLGSSSTALDMSPSLFDLIFTCDQATQICVGHQSGEELNNEVFLSVFSVDGITSPFHVFARVTVVEL